MRSKTKKILPLIFTLVAMIILYFNSDMDNKIFKAIFITVATLSVIFILLIALKKDKIK